MKKTLIFIIILIGTSISLTFGASTKLKNAEQPKINPIQIKVTSKPVGPIENKTIDLSKHGLKYLGAILIDGDHPAFGGFSDLIISDDRKSFLTISDMGFWLKGDFIYSKNGELLGVKPAAALGQLLSITGATFTNKFRSDAEAICRAPDSGFLVSYERVHRINHYNSGKDFDLSGTPTSIDTPEHLSKLPENGGIESLVRLPDNRILMIAEGNTEDENISYAAIGNNGKWTELKYIKQETFRPTSVANLPHGDLLVLERSYTGPGSLEIRFKVIKKPSFKSGDSLIPEAFFNMPRSIPIDNYEGIDTVTTDDGRTFIYVISDDNFSPLQHTILMMFELIKTAK